MNIRDLIVASTLHGPSDMAQFNRFRGQAVEEAMAIYEDRARSYNVDRAPTDEMPYGMVSLSSEIFKRARRMASLTSPIREEDVRTEDLDRIKDTCTDLINYASWMYALVQIAERRSGGLPKSAYESGSIRVTGANLDEALDALEVAMSVHDHPFVYSPDLTDDSGAPLCAYERKVGAHAGKCLKPAHAHS